MSIRAHGTKRTRSKNTDVSEYLGYDTIYQAMLQHKRVRLLSPDIPCGPRCSSVASDTRSSDETTGSTVWEKPWKGSEIALLNKLEHCLGPNPCILAALVGTRSCSDVADFVEHRARFARRDASNYELLRRGVDGKSRERCNGVIGNSYEHLCRTRSQRMKDRGANHEYIPCNQHGASCNSAQCSCIRRDHYCEKACGCSPDFSNRFPGCHCEVGQCRTSACPCYFAARECDPDTCTSCGASELPVVLADDESKHKTIAQLKISGNVNLLRGKMHRIGVSASETHGWGAYALETAKKGEFMYEYIWLLVIPRRSRAAREHSVVDATRKGNKSKFANHDRSKPLANRGRAAVVTVDEERHPRSTTWKRTSRYRRFRFFRNIAAICPGRYSPSSLTTKLSSESSSNGSFRRTRDSFLKRSRRCEAADVECFCRKSSNAC
ncbi:hypothetical protein PsorP6_000866 [Peronosclerospora sorghi]|uniref:Uncharacterized protein n=1 Tax=Peronosclerospora sorghi TaxID=230839 RepID=A0ACC0WTD2_9STRA|nr:hypothetical protein PsorP6_000866 [Peronosclerospora sorghi]